MKDFKKHVFSESSPAFGDRDICWYLQQPSFDVLRSDLVNNPNQPNSTKGMHLSIPRFLNSLSHWKQGSPNKKLRGEYDSYASENIMICDPAKRAAWTKHIGRAYRGLQKTSTDITKYKLNYTGQVINITVPNRPPYIALVATGVYKSAYKNQSWSTMIEVAHDFATGYAPGMMQKTRKKIGMILEMDMKPSDNTLFVDPFPRMGKEHEVILSSSANIQVKVYVDLEDIVNQITDAKDKGRDKAKKLLGSSYEKVILSVPFRKLIDLS